MKNCSHTKVRKITQTNEKDDVEQTICEDPECGRILFEVVITEGIDGERVEKPRAVKPPPTQEIPEGIGVIVKTQGKSVKPRQNPRDNPTAAEMTILAENARHRADRTAIDHIVKTALADCREAAKKGELRTEYTIGPDSNTEGTTISAAVKELKTLGYKVSKKTDPVEGTCLTIKWGTPPKKTPEPPTREEIADQTKRNTPGMVVEPSSKPPKKGWFGK